MINVFDFGIKPGSVNADANRVIFQGLINSAKKTLCVPEDVYYNGSLLIRDNTSILVEHGAKMILDQSKSRPTYNKWPWYSNILMGAWGRGNIETLKVAAPKVNDVVWLRAKTAFMVGGVSRIPTYGQLNIVKSVNPLLFEYDVVIDDYEIVSLSNNGNNFIGTDEPQYLAHNARIKGGTWINNVSEGAFSTCEGIGCHIDVDKIYARNGVGYGNLQAYNTLKCREMHTRKSIIEIAMNSHDNFIDINYAECSGETLKQSQAAIWINEGSRNNRINIDTAISRGEHHAGVFIDTASNNSVNVNVMEATNIRRAVDIRISAFKGDTPETLGNNVVINKSNSDDYIALKNNTVIINYAN